MNEPPSPADRRLLARAPFARLVLRLLIVLLAFAAVPLALHEPFRRADSERRAMLLRNAQDQATVIAAALTPLLDRDDPRAVERIDAAARAFADDGTTLRIVRTPRVAGAGATAGARDDDDGAFLVVAHPPVADRDFAAIRARLREADGAGLDRTRCTGSATLETRIATAAGVTEILGAAAMNQSATGCWTVLVGWRSAPFLASSLGRPYWDTPEMHVAGLAYLALLLVMLLLVVRGWNDARVVTAPAGAARRSTGAPAILVAPPSMLSPRQETTIVATLREAAAASRQPLPAVELRKRVADRVFDFHDDCTRSGLSLSYEALHPVQVQASAAEVDAVVSALLTRALRASRPGDVLRVAMRAGADDREATLIVEDGGHGDPDDADGVIERVRHDLEAIGGSLDMTRLENKALRLAARFQRAPDPTPPSAPNSGD